MLVNSLSLVSRRLLQLTVSTIHKVKPGTFVQLWMGFYLNNLLVPPCMLYTYLTSAVVWSGVKYEKRAGKVVSVEEVQ